MTVTPSTPPVPSAVPSAVHPRAASGPILPAAVLLLAALLTAPWALPASARAEGARRAAAPNQPPAAAEKAPAAPQEGVRMRSASRTLQRIWWNQEDLVASLGLREEQRKAMDRELVDFLEKRREAAGESLELRRRLADQLAAGRWEEAEATAQALGRVQGGVGRAEADLVTAVVKRLEPAQRETLAADHPRLLAVPWIRASPPTRLRTAPQARSGGAAPGGRGP